MIIREQEIIDERYRIIKELGEGGFAYVYQAEDIITGKEVALKIIKENALKSKDNLIRFEREARASASLNHPNIVKVVNIGYHHDLPYMASDAVSSADVELLVRLLFAPRTESYK